MALGACQMLRTRAEARGRLPFGGFHKDGRGDSSVEAGKAFVLDDLSKAIEHAVVAFTSNALALL